MTGNVHRRQFRLGSFPVFLVVALLVLLAACATSPPDYRQEALRILQECDTELQLDDTRWCLGVMNIKGFVLVKQIANHEPQFSEPLPIRTTISLKMIETLTYGFGSLWVSYSGHPMGLLRVDPDTLSVQAQIPMDTGWFSRRFGSLGGSVVVGYGAVWVLSEGLLYRVDPLSNTIRASRKFPGRSLAMGQGALWMAAADQVIKVDPESLDILQSFSVPAGTNVWDGVEYAPILKLIVKNQSAGTPVTGVLTVDEASVFVLLSVRRKGFFACGSHCLPSLVGRLDPATSTVVVENCFDWWQAESDACLNDTLPSAP